MLYRFFTVSVLIISLIGCCTAAGTATIKGYVLDGKTGAPRTNTRVDVFRSEDHSRPVVFTRTDEKGFYSVTVPSGSYYDVYVRLGDVNPDQRTKTVVEDYGVYTLNFEIYSESTFSGKAAERYGFWAVVLIAVIILLLILADQFFFRRKRILKELETKQMMLQSELDEGRAVGDGLSKLKYEKNELDYKINLARIKYHKHEIDEESFREIMRDYQKRLIEIEAKLNRFEEEE
jgi:5-hydroxyisourate hydrolase-like protein (transthyretin family)